MMRKYFLAVVCCCSAWAAAQTAKPAIPRDEQLEAKVEKTLAKMTLDEKIGQMLELNLDIMGTYDASGKCLTPVSLNTKWDRCSMHREHALLP